MRVLPFFISFVVVLSGCSPHPQTPVAESLTGPYLGQVVPKDEPALFAPGFVNTGLMTRDITISPDGDEIYFCASLGNYSFSAILVTRQVDGRWTEPEVLPFCTDPGIKNLEPFISPDGQRLYFVSDRADPASGRQDNEDIWFVDRIQDGWGEPVNLGEPVNSELSEYFPSVTRDGTIYFTRENRQDGTGGIYRCRFVDGTYVEAERLPDQVNAGNMRFNAFVSPDEDYLIVPVLGLEDSRGSVDYYICFRNEQDRWTEPINLGDRVNTESGREYSAYVSPDGSYLFFMSARQVQPPDRLSWSALQAMHDEPGHGVPAIWWVGAEFLRDLRP